MIKKLLIGTILSIGFGLFSTAQNCVPSSQFTTPGIHPDSATNFVQGYANQPYSQLITVIIPVDTVVLNLHFNWDSTVLVNITGLPNGFTWACWNNATPNARCRWKGNSTGCAIITGNPTIADTGLYPLSISTKNYIGGSPSPNNYTINYYKIKINAPLGIANLDANKFMVGDCSPNPFSNKTEFNFNSPDPKVMAIKVYNLVGVEVYSMNYRAARGINHFNFDRNTLAPGIYIYSISNGDQTISKRMVISN